MKHTGAHENDPTGHGYILFRTWAAKQESTAPPSTQTSFAPCAALSSMTRLSLANKIYTGSAKIVGQVEAGGGQSKRRAKSSDSGQASETLRPFGTHLAGTMSTPTTTAPASMYLSARPAGRAAQPGGDQVTWCHRACATTADVMPVPWRIAWSKGGGGGALRARAHRCMRGRCPTLRR